MGAKEPRGTEVAFSTSQLDDAGITDDINDNALSDIVDDFFRTFSREFAESVQQWLDEHQDEDEEPYPPLTHEGDPEFNGAFG